MALFVYRKPVRRSVFDDFLYDDYNDDPFSSMHYHVPRCRRYLRPRMPEGRYFIKVKHEEKVKQNEKEMQNTPTTAVESSEDPESNSVKGLINYLWFCPASKANTTDETPKKSSDSLREVFPFNMSNYSNESGPFQVNVNLSGCDPDKITVDIKDGLIKIEGKRVGSDGTYLHVKHEQSLPKDIPPSSLVASFLADGTLSVHQKESQSIPVALEGEKQEPMEEETKEESALRNKL